MQAVYYYDVCLEEYNKESMNYDAQKLEYYSPFQITGEQFNFIINEVSKGIKLVQNQTGECENFVVALDEWLKDYELYRKPNAKIRI